MKTCKKCGRKVVGWNKPYFEKSGKWRLVDHKTIDGVWCIRNNIVEQKEKKITKKDCILCPLCSETNFGLCRSKEDFERHTKMYHPNGEVRDNKYFQCN